MSDTDTSGDEDQFMEDEVHEVNKYKIQRIIFLSSSFELDTNSNSFRNSILGNKYRP
jgi:hypothetical protein